MFTSTQNSSIEKKNQSDSLPIENGGGYIIRGFSALSNGIVSASSKIFHATAWGVKAPINGAKSVCNGICSAVVSKLCGDPLVYLVDCFTKSILNKNPVSDSNITARIKELDENNNLPVLSGEIATFILNKIKKGKLEKIKFYPEDTGEIYQQKQELKNFYSDESGRLLTCLTFFIQRSLSYLACYQDKKNENESGQLIINIFNNLHAIISNNINDSLFDQIREYTELYGQYVNSCESKKSDIESKIEDLMAKKELLSKQLDILQGDEKKLVEAKLKALEINLKKYNSLHSKYEEYVSNYYEMYPIDQALGYDHQVLSYDEWLDWLALNSPKILEAFPQSDLEKELIEKRKEIINQFKPLLTNFLDAIGFNKEIYDLIFEGMGLKGGSIEKWISPKDDGSETMVVRKVHSILLDNLHILLDLFAESKFVFDKPENIVSKSNLSIDGYDELKQDSRAIAKKLTPLIFNFLGKTSSSLSYSVKDAFDAIGIKQLDRQWIEKLFSHFSDNKSGLTNSLGKFLEDLIFPRLFLALEQAALSDPKAVGSLLERLIINVIHLIKDFLSNHAPHPDQIEECNQINLLSDALLWRNRYLKEVKGASHNECNQKASELTSDDISEIYQMAGYSEDKQIELIRAALKQFNCTSFEYANDVEKGFFQGGDLEEAEKMRQEKLSKTFGTLTDNLLGLLNFAHDANFYLPGATGDQEAWYSLESLKKSVIPSQLLNVYRNMSDFSERTKFIDKQLKTIFGKDNDILLDLSTVFTRSLINFSKESINGNEGAKGKAADIAAAINRSGYFVTSKGQLIKTIQSLFTDRTILLTPNDHAVEELDKYIEIVLQACMLKIFVAFGSRRKPAANQNDNISKSQNVFQRIRSGILQSSQIGKGMSQQSSQLISQILITLTELFTKHRTSLQEGMKDYWVLDKAKAEAGTLAPEEKEITDQMFNKLLEKKLDLFKPLTLELLEASGITVKDFNLPEPVEGFVWDMVVEQIQSNISQIYIDMTKWERSQRVDSKKLNEIGLKHGAGASVALSHLIVENIQSLLALNTQAIQDTIYEKAKDFLNHSNISEAKDLANSLEEKDNCLEFKKMLGDNISNVVRDDSIKEILLALENYVQPILQKTILAIGKNLKEAQEKNPKILKKIAKDIVLFSGEHFKKIHAVTLIENKKNPYEVDSVKMLEAVTSDEDILGYVILKEKENKAQQVKFERKKAWSLTAAGKKEIKKSIIEAEQALKKIKQQIADYITPKWPDEGIAVEKYLKAEQSLRKRETELRAAQQTLRQRWENFINKKNPKETSELKKARQNYKEAKKHLDNMKETVDAVARQNKYVTEYLSLLAKKERAKGKGEEKLAEAKEKLEKYINATWKDGGKAIKEFLEIKKAYIELKNQYIAVLTNVQKKAQAKILDLNDTEELRGVREERDQTKNKFQKAALALDRAMCPNKIEKIHAHGEAKLINLCLDKKYIELEGKLANASDGPNKEKAQREIDEYALEMYFKPLTKKILKLANEEQFDKLPFPSLLKEHKETILKLVKSDQLPKILAMIIGNIYKPETLMQIVLNAVKSLNANAENSASSQAGTKHVAPDDDFDNECGNMIMDAIEMGALGIEGDIFSLAAKMINLQDSAGKALGKALREYLESQSPLKLFEAALSSGASSLVPDGKWMDNGDFVVNYDKKTVPLTPSDVAQADLQKQAAINRTNREFNQELAKLAENNIKAQAKAFLSNFSGPWKNFRLGVHSSIDSFALRMKNAFGINCETFAERLKEDFDMFAKKIYDVIAAIVNLFASIAVWPVIRLVGLFNNFFNSRVENIKKLVSMLIHKRLIFQYVNIFISTIENELSELKTSKQ